MKKLPITLLALACIIVGSARCAPQTKFEIAAEEVTGISANLFNRPDKGPAIPEFEIPQSFHQKVLNLIDGAKPHRSQIDWAVLGTLEIRKSTGPVKLQLFTAGDRVVFHVTEGGSYEARTLEALIRTIEKAEKAAANAKNR